MLKHRLSPNDVRTIVFSNSADIDTDSVWAMASGLRSARVDEYDGAMLSNGACTIVHCRGETFIHRYIQIYSYT